MGPIAMLHPAQPRGMPWVERGCARGGQSGHHGGCPGGSSMTHRSALTLLIALAFFTCAADWDRRPVRPDLPGPIDLLRGVFGDNSSRCPHHYEYCSSQICCPLEQGCCRDAHGSYCCTSRGGAYDEGDRYYYHREEHTQTRHHEEQCDSDEVQCVQGGRS